MFLSQHYPPVKYRIGTVGCGVQTAPQQQHEIQS